MFNRFFSSRRNDVSASDLYHVMQASQSLMGEIVLEKLLPKLLKMTVEMSQATKGAIVVVNDKSLEIAAIGQLKPNIQIDLVSQNLESSNLLPGSIIQQAFRLQKIIWLKSARTIKVFSSDPYIQANQPKTVLCLPLYGNQKKLIALIYLENNLLTDGIEPKTINILKLMVIPAGLCIENARLYQEVENYSSSLKEAVQDLQCSQQIARGQTEVLTNILDVLTREPELDKLIEIVLSSITIKLNATAAIVCLYDFQQDKISHYMGYQSNSSQISAQNLRSEQTYFEVSKHPFWSRLINLTEPIYLSVTSSEIIDAELYRSLDSQGIKSMLVLPLLVGNQLLGLLGIYFSSTKKIPPERIELASALAKQTSLAIQLTKLADLNRSTAIFKERNRLACEIHDTLAQTFTGISMQVGLAQRLIEQKPAEAKSLIARIGELARAGIIESRRSVWALFPESLEFSDLSSALSQLLEEMTANLEIKTEFNLQGNPVLLDSQVSLNLLRIAQEALTNVLKHAQAQNICLELRFNQDSVLLRLRDDGQGFNVMEKNNKVGFGLVGMSQRAEQLDSKLIIVSSPGKGTDVSVQIDLSNCLNLTE